MDILCTDQPKFPNWESRLFRAELFADVLDGLTHGAGRKIRTAIDVAGGEGASQRHEPGRRVSDLTEKLGKDVSKLQQARVAFLASLCPDLVVINEDDHYHHAVGI